MSSSSEATDLSSNSDSSNSDGRKLRRTLVLFLKLLLTAVILFFVGRNVWQNWDQVAAYQWQVQWLPLLVSLVMAQLGFFTFAVCWKMIIGAFGHRLSPLESFRIANLSNLGRYVPGKVWQVFGMLYLAGKKGVASEQTAASFVLWQIFTIPASLLVYMIASQFESRLLVDKFALLGQDSAYILGGLSLLGCLLLVLYPEPFLKLANGILKRLGRKPAKFKLDKRVALSIFLGYFFGWVFSGLAFWLFLRSVLGTQAPSAIASVGLYNVAYQMGYLALFAPGGIGVREAVMGLLLQAFIGPLGVAVAVMARIWAVVIDSLAALIALAIKK